MTKEELMSLLKIKAEIKLIENQLDNIKPEYITDSVKGSDKDFPYTEHSFKISGYDEKEYNRKILRIKNKLKNKQKDLLDAQEKITDFIYNQKDSDLRQILIYKYIDGSTLEEAAIKMKYATITVKIKHSNFLKSI